MLVTSLDARDFPAQAMPRHYRERADAENNYDELKKQWGWNGYTSKCLASSRLMANLVALFYNPKKENGPPDNGGNYRKSHRSAMDLKFLITSKLMSCVI